MQQQNTQRQTIGKRVWREMSQVIEARIEVNEVVCEASAVAR